MNQSEISRRAIAFCAAFGLNGRSKRKKKRGFDRVFETLIEYGITLDSIEDGVWERLTYDLTIGHFDPSTFTISVPNRVYVNACKGERDALFIIMHELGHFVLGHRAVLHKSSKPPIQCEDAEWQADTFADIVLSRLGYETKQLTFDFYM
ncbi:ImmA/IrrE family metallo-endopeptidase [Morganella morganii]|nr:ImmA/IrrE family metallo-endopeptidase [Morganella morganii subsp. morganii]QWL91605.1 ImmA/IrrE family metallo-endopeptidase [Morganella morganii subsp. morganii]HAT1512338.1 ImmA/IrrE family metallo-endopeptidase [Morganella morganii]